MPRSSKRTSFRARREPQKQETQSPVRPTKRRKKLGGSLDMSDSSWPAAAADMDDDDDDGPFALEQTGQGSGGDDDVSQITPYLLSSLEPVQASRDHSNAIHETNEGGFEAYAQIAAKDWTFFVTRPYINIGRSSEAHQQQAGNGGADGRATDAEDLDAVHIDLGPSKIVSRQHARVWFDPKADGWFLDVKGRNGARIDGVMAKQGSSHTVTSGQVIELGGVEMMFVLPSEISPLSIHDSFRQRRAARQEGHVTPRRFNPRAAQDEKQPRPKEPRELAISQPPLLAPAPADYKRAHRIGTPSPPSPTRSRRAAAATGAAPSPRPQDAAPMHRGSNGIDFKLDDNQHAKPQYSYAQLITQAIMQAPGGKLNLNGIYNFIMDNYSYYRHQNAAGWQNSIRHNLSLNRAFGKVARSTDEPGKGMKWQIVPEAKEDMVSNAYKVGRGGHRGSSAPSSPGQLSYISHGPRDVAARDPMSARKRKASPAYSSPNTPRRNTTLGRSPLPDDSPISRTRRGAPDSSVSTSTSVDRPPPQSPTLTSSLLPEEASSFVTPAPPRFQLKLGPPSTAQRPSQHMPTSSPAPFWKYADIGSTPLRPAAQLDLSPSQAHDAAPLLPPSSPLRAVRSPVSSPSRPHRQPPAETPHEDRDSADEQGFDLTKGFQSIGSYHAPLGRGAALPPAVNNRP